MSDSSINIANETPNKNVPEYKGCPLYIYGISNDNNLIDTNTNNNETDEGMIAFFTMIMGTQLTGNKSDITDKKENKMVNIPVIVKIICYPDITDMQSLENDNTDRTLNHNDNYRAYKINAGYIQEITDIAGKKFYTTALVNGKYDFHVGKWFKIKNYDYNLNMRSLLVFKTIEGAINDIKLGDLPENYTGNLNRYYSNGNIHQILHIHNGKLRKVFYYNNDDYNTQSRMIIPNHEYVYDSLGNIITEYDYNNSNNTNKRIRIEFTDSLSDEIDTKSKYPRFFNT